MLITLTFFLIKKVNTLILLQIGNNHSAISFILMQKPGKKTLRELNEVYRKLKKERDTVPNMADASSRKSSELARRFEFRNEPETNITFSVRFNKLQRFSILDDN